MLFVWNVAIVVVVAAAAVTGALAAGLAVISRVLDVSDIIWFLDHDKSCSS